MRLKGLTCPKCGMEREGATGLREKAVPSPGDFSVCIGCAELLRFQAGITGAVESLVLCRPEELKELDPAGVVLLLRARDAIRDRIRKGN